MIKTTMHIQPSQFEFIGFEYEEGDEVTQNDIKLALEAFNRTKQAINGGFGLEPKEFNRVYDSFLTNGEIVGDPGIIEQMDLGQQRSINDLKKAVKRVEAKELKGK